MDDGLLRGRVFGACGGPVPCPCPWTGGGLGLDGFAGRRVDGWRRVAVWRPSAAFGFGLPSGGGPDVGCGGKSDYWRLIPDSANMMTGARDCAPKTNASSTVNIAVRSRK